jgi:outer membrane protein assembly factor BamB
MRGILFVVLVILVVALVGISFTLLTGSSTTTTQTLTNGASSRSCVSHAAGVDQWLTYKSNPQRTGYTNATFTSPGGKFLGQLAWYNANVGMTYEMVSLYGRVFAANYYLNALSLANGSLLWANATGVGPYPSMASDGRMVFLGSNGGGLVAFDPLTGKEMASMNQVMALGATAICGGVAFVSSVPGIGFPQSPSGSLLALNLTTGKTLWGVNLTSGEFEGFPTTDGRFVYSIVPNNALAAYSAETGQPAWRKAFPQNLTSTPPVQDGELFVSTVDGRVYALNAKSGNEIWSTKVNGTIEDVRSSLAVGYGEVFLGTSGGLYALNATSGSILWRTGIEGFTFGTPTVVDGVVLVANQGGTLYEFNASNGTLLWSFAGLGVGYVSEPVVADGLVVVDGVNGIFAFH